MEGAINSIAYPNKISPLAPVSSLARLQALMRWAIRSKAAFSVLLPLAPRWERRSKNRGKAKAAAVRAATQALAVLEREKRRRWGSLVPPEPVPKGRELEALEATLHMYWVIANHPGLPFSARKNARRALAKAKGRLLRNSVWKPPVPAPVAVRPPLPELPKPRQRTPHSSGSVPRDGPEDSEGGEEGSAEESSDPPPPPRARARGRGRPRKGRRFRASPDSRTYKKRLQKLDEIAAALEGQADSFFLTLVPLEPPDDSARRLAAVPRDIARAFSGFAARLRRAKATFALLVATRTDSGAFYPHGHALVAGVDPKKLARWAALEGLRLHVEQLKAPGAAARYIVAAGQKRHWDGILGGRGFYSSAPVSSRNTAIQAQELRHVEIPVGLELGPGIKIADPAVFMDALRRDLESRIPAVQAAARHRLALLRRALLEGGPP